MLPQDWSKVKSTLEKEVKTDKEASKFLSTLFKKFNQDLSSKLKAPEAAKTICDQYAAAFRASAVASDYRKIIKSTKDWPESLEEGQTTLDEALKDIETEVEKSLKQYESLVSKARNEIIDVWSKIRSTETPIKDLEKALAKWQKATSGDYKGLLLKAEKAGPQKLDQIYGYLMDMAVEIKDGALASVPNSNGENKLLTDALDMVMKAAYSLRDFFEQKKKQNAVENLGAPEHDDKKDKM